MLLTFVVDDVIVYWRTWHTIRATEVSGSGISGVSVGSIGSYSKSLTPGEAVELGVYTTSTSSATGTGTLQRPKRVSATPNAEGRNTEIIVSRVENNVPETYGMS